MSAKNSSTGRKLLSGAVLRVVSLATAALAALFLMPFIVRHIGDRLYGFWSLASAFIGYYGLIDLGLSSAVSQYLSIAIGRNDPKECQQVYNTALRINCLFGIAALFVTAIIVIATPCFSRSPDDAHLFREVIGILGVNTAISFPLRVYNGVLEAQYRFDISSGLTMLALGLRTGLTVLAILAGGGIVALAWVTLLASLPVAILQIVFGRREAHWVRIITGWIDTNRMKSLFSYGSHTFLAYLADILRFQVDPLVISGIIGLEAVTHYRVAEVFTRYFLQILILAVGILQPLFSRLHGNGNHSTLESVFYFATKVSCCISVFICLALAGWGKPFVTLWMGPKYNDGYVPLVILSFAAFLDVCQKPSIDLLYATFKHRFYTYINWAEGIINLAMSLFLARHFGIAGVAMGTLIGAVIIRAIVQPWWTCRVTNLNYGTYVRFLARNLLSCSAIMIASTALVSWGLRPSYPYLIASAVFATCLYTAGSWFFLFDDKERQQLSSAFTNRGKKQGTAILGTAV